MPQGLAVYQNGVRINESFGDIVNWDFLPEVAIGNVTLLSNNPVYGLNALGGAVVVNMKNGFDYHGAEITASGGSFGRPQGTAEVGMQRGNVPLYWGGERITDDGYRDFSGAEIRRMYGDLGFRNKDVEVHLNITAADNFVGVTAAAPVQLLGLGWNRTFSSPQTTKNEVVMPALNATVNASDTLSFAGVAYYRHFKQSHDDGNISEAEDLRSGPGPSGHALHRRRAASRPDRQSPSTTTLPAMPRSAPSTGRRRTPKAGAHRSRRWRSRTCSATRISSWSARAMTVGTCGTTHRASSARSNRSSWWMGWVSFCPRLTT